MVYNKVAIAKYRDENREKFLESQRLASRRHYDLNKESINEKRRQKRQQNKFRTCSQIDDQIHEGLKDSQLILSI